MQPVSDPNSLLAGMQGIFEDFGAHSPIFVSIQRVNPKAYSQIPYAMEQGIFACLAGNFLREQGIIDREQGIRPSEQFFRHTQLNRSSRLRVAG